MLIAAIPFVALGALVLSARDKRLAGTNSVPPASYVAVLKPGEEICQPHQTVPDDAAEMRVFAGVYGQPGPQLAVSIRRGGLMFRAASTRGYGDGALDVRIPARARGVGDATVCLRNRGSSRLALAGRGEPPSGTLIDGRPFDGRLYVAWMRPGRESWLDLAATVAARAGVAKARFMGSWTLWMAFALLAVAAVAATFVLARAEEP